MTDPLATIELTPYRRHSGSEWISCVVALELHIEGKSFRTAFTRDGGLLHSDEWQELIQGSRAYVRRVRELYPTRQDMFFAFDSLEGGFTIRMENFTLPSDEELNAQSIIFSFSMSLSAIVRNSNVSLSISTSFHMDHVLAFIDQFEREIDTITV